MSELRYHKRAGTVVPNAAVMLLAVASLCGCGADDAVEAELSVAEPAAVVLADPDDVEAGLVADSSYIVTFRTEGAGDRLHFSNYRHEYRQHYLPLAANFAADSRVRDIQFITSVDLTPTAPQDDAFWSLEFGVPPALRHAWGKRIGAERVVGSMARVDFTDAAAARNLLVEWHRQGRLWFAEPNYVSRLSTQEDDERIESFDAMATAYESEELFWWSDSIMLPNAFRTMHAKLNNAATAISDPKTRPIVAVLDSGVDYKHPALAGRIWENQDVNAASCSDDLYGCNTTVAERGKLGNGDVYPYDTDAAGRSCSGLDPNCSHGTHVAGIIAGDYNYRDPETGKRVAGVCPVCQIMIVKIVSRVGKQSGILDSSIISAFKYVSLFNSDEETAVRVINASFGKFVRSRSVGLLVRLMKEKRGTLVVGAAGNEDTLRMEYPAAFTDAIAVAAVDRDLRKGSFSNFGRWVDVSAPGNAILSTVPGKLFDSKSGTSMAAPFVAGVAGLMVAADPDISFSNLRRWLLESADPSFYRSDSNDGFNHRYYYPDIPGEDTRQPLLGNGLLNANKALLRQPTDGLPVYTALDRVEKGCSVVARGTGPSPTSTAVLLLLAVIAPLLSLRRHRFTGGK